MTPNNVFDDCDMDLYSESREKRRGRILLKFTVNHNTFQRELKQIKEQFIYDFIKIVLLKG